MRRTIYLIPLLILIAVITGVAAWELYTPNNRRDETVRVMLGAAQLQLWVADDPDERAQGLMGITQLDEVQGMLFLFDDANLRVFWNKDTTLPLGIIWLRDGIVLGTSTLPDVRAHGIVRTSSPSPSNQVIELSKNDPAFRAIQRGERLLMQ